MARPNPRNVTLIPNGLDSEPWASQQFAASTSASTPQISLIDMAGFDQSLFNRPRNLLRTDSRPHPIVPEDHLSGDGNGNFLDFPPDLPSAEEHQVCYLGVLKSFGPEGERTAVVRTLDRCDVVCSTEGCEGLERLHDIKLVQIIHHLSGDDEGKTFVSHVSDECTPTASNAASRAASHPPSRTLSPVRG